MGETACQGFFSVAYSPRIGYKDYTEREEELKRHSMKGIIRMAKTEKTPNYTESQMFDMSRKYSANPSSATVDELAKDMNRTRRSVIAKLTHMGIYVKEAQAPKTLKDEGPTKKDLLAQLEAADPSFPIEGITPATKEAIAAVLALVQAESADEVAEEVAA
jgi:cyclophilin family peptidyl-prolyl cis-trans isomerase